MKLEGERNLLRIYLRNTDKRSWFSMPAAIELIERAKEQGLAGGTVLRGFFGLDITGRLLETANWSLVEHVPLILEFVDSSDAIGRFLSIVDEILLEGLVTIERGHVLLYRHRNQTTQRTTSLKVPDRIAPLSTLPSRVEFPVMKATTEGQLVRVFIGESDEHQGQSLYRAIVLKAQELGLAGATVLHGPIGFGAHSRIHSNAVLELSTDLPVIVEIVDTPEKVQLLLPYLDDVISEGLVTIEALQLLKYSRNQT